MKNCHIINISLSLALLSVLSCHKIKNVTTGPAQHYTWGKVRIGGGGNVIDVKVHPLVSGLVFVSTDVGTCYKWDAKNEKWHNMMEGNIPLEYWTYDMHTACGDIAFDPTDKTGKIYYATIIHGKGTKPGGGTKKGTVLKTRDGGISWTDCELPITVRPNSDQAYNDRLVVDPNNGKIVFVTSSSDGTWRSNNAGAPGSWQKVNIPFGNNTGAFLMFDKRSGLANGATKRIYIGAAKEGVYKSEDAGYTFTLLPGTPVNLKRADISYDGTLVVNYGNANWDMNIQHNAGVMKWDGKTWTDISPVSLKKGQYFSGPGIHPHNHNEIIVATSGTWSRDAFYISKNGGLTWSELNNRKDFSQKPYDPSEAVGNNTNTFAFDPLNKGCVWFTDWLSAMQTKNVWEASPVWKVQVNGLEEVVVTGPLVCPPFGINQLHSVTADVGGIDHKDVTLPPMVSVSRFFRSTEGVNTSTVAIQYNDPNFIARIGSNGWSGNGLGGYATDGTHYTNFQTLPGARGRLAIASGNKNMVWISQEPGIAYYSHDLGNTWLPSRGLDRHILRPGSQWMIYAGQNPIAADKVKPNTFYVYDKGRFFVSEDGGKEFKMTNDRLPNVGDVAKMNVETSPGIAGDIWISFGSRGLYHSADGGRNFEQVGSDAIQESRWVAVGRDRPDAANIAVYVSGNVNGTMYGIYRSDDLGKTWTAVQQPTMSVPLNLAADVHGRVFYGTPGNGIYYLELLQKVQQ